jgi:hypothetical protein
MVLDDEIGKRRNAQSRYGRYGEGGAVIRLEPAMRMNGDRLVVTVDESPGFGPLHERLVLEKLFRCLRGAMLLYVARACDELAMDGTYATSDQVRVAEITDADRAIETHPDNIHEAVTVISELLT